jgi:F-BAR domain only protein
VTQSIRINNFPALEAIGPNRIFVTNHADQPDQFTLDLNQLRPVQSTIAFSYRLHVEADKPPVDRVPVLINPAWKPQGDKLGLLLQYKLNPTFKLEGSSVTLHNLVLFATYEGKASGAQTKPSGTHLKEKHLVYWRLGDVTLTRGADFNKIVCRIIGDAGVEPRPGKVEARWELSYNNAEAEKDAITVSKLEEGKGKDKEVDVPVANDDDPFADTDAASKVSNIEGRWVDIPGVRNAISGKYEAI